MAFLVFSRSPEAEFTRLIVGGVRFHVGASHRLLKLGSGFPLLPDPWMHTGLSSANQDKGEVVRIFLNQEWRHAC